MLISLTSSYDFAWVWLIFIRVFDIINKNKNQRMKDFMSEGQHISVFKREGVEQIFPNAQKFPDFFKNHLLDPNRIIKIFENDPHANERIFYYQYLRICEDYENSSSQQRIQNMKEFVQNQELTILFPQSHTQPPFTDPQFKRIIYEFMDMITEEQITVDEALKLYPIVDIVFVTLMRTLLIYNNKAESFEEYIDRNETFAYLSSIFDVELQLFDKCIKFTDADIFVYEEIPNQVYMAYVTEDEAENSPKQNKTLLRPNQKQSNQMYTSSNSSAYDFVDFTNKQTGVEEKEREVLQPKLTSTLKMSRQDVPKITEMRQEQIRDDEFEKQSIEESLSDDLEKEFQMPNQIIHPPEQLLVSKEVFMRVEEEQEEKEFIEEEGVKEEEFEEREDEIEENVDKSDVVENDDKISTQQINITSNCQQNIVEKQPVKPAKEEEKQVKPEEVGTPARPLKNNGLFFPKLDTQISKQYSLNSNRKIDDAYKPFFYEPVDRLKLSNFEESERKKGRTEIYPMVTGKVRLNVSSQFTNSFLLSKVREPYRSSIQETKERARVYRKSINRQLI